MPYFRIGKSLNTLTKTWSTQYPIYCYRVPLSRQTRFLQCWSDRKELSSLKTTEHQSSAVMPWCCCAHCSLAAFCCSVSSGLSAATWHFTPVSFMLVERQTKHNLMKESRLRNFRSNLILNLRLQRARINAPESQIGMAKEGRKEPNLNLHDQIFRLIPHSPTIQYPHAGH